MPRGAAQRAGCGTCIASRRFQTLLFISRAAGRGVQRILSGRPKLKYYEAGMDLGMSYDRAESSGCSRRGFWRSTTRWWTRQFRVLDGTLPVNKLPKTDARDCGLQDRSKTVRSTRSGIGVRMPDQEKEKAAAVFHQPKLPRRHLRGRAAPGCSENGGGKRGSFFSIFFGEPLVGLIRAKLPAA